MARRKTFPPEDAWPIYQILVRHPIGRQQLTFRGDASRWVYLLRHIDEAPSTVIDPLEELKRNDPRSFAMAFGGALGQFWDYVPESWRQSILGDEGSRSCESLEEIYWGMHMALLSPNGCPPQLSEHLLLRFKDPDSSLREIAGSFILLYWDHLSEEHHKSLEDLFADPTNFSIATEVFRQGAGANDGTLMAVCRLATWVEGAEAGEVINILLEKRELSKQTWDAAEPLIHKGGHYSRAALIWATLQRSRYAQNDLPASFVIDLPLDWFAEPTPVRTALIWYCAITAQKEVDGLPVDEASWIELLKSLRGRDLFAAAYILAHQSRYLPERFSDIAFAYLREQGKDVNDYIDSGLEEGKRENTTSSRTIPGFPISFYIRAHGDASGQTDGA